MQLNKLGGGAGNKAKRITGSARSASSSRDKAQVHGDRVAKLLLTNSHPTEIGAVKLFDSFLSFFL